jgi:hypothetical protein
VARYRVANCKDLPVQCLEDVTPAMLGAAGDVRVGTPAGTDDWRLYYSGPRYGCRSIKGRLLHERWWSDKLAWPPFKRVTAETPEEFAQLPVWRKLLPDEQTGPARSSPCPGRHRCQTCGDPDGAELQGTRLGIGEPSDSNRSGKESLRTRVEVKDDVGR